MSPLGRYNQLNPPTSNRVHDACRHHGPYRVGAPTQFFLESILLPTPVCMILCVPLSVCDFQLFIWVCVLFICSSGRVCFSYAPLDVCDFHIRLWVCVIFVCSSGTVWVYVIVMCSTERM